MKGKFDWRAAYYNVVSLVAMIFFLVGAVQAGHGVLRVVFPTLSIDRYEWERVQSYEAFKNNPGDFYGRPKPVREMGDTSAAAPVPSEEEMHHLWEEHRKLVVEGERRQGFWGMLEPLGTMVVAVPILWFHRRAAKRLRDHEDDPGQ